MAQTEVLNSGYLPKGTLKQVEVSVAGTTVKVKTDATPASLKQVQDLLESKFSQLQGKNASTEKTALLVALNLAEELLEERERVRHLKRQILDRSERLLERVESHLDQLV